MATKFQILLLLVITAQILGDPVTKGTILISTFLIHRHGDRTPSATQLAYSSDAEVLEPAIRQYGYGQLTNLGKRRAYNLGKFIRTRYGELLSDQYNRSEIYIRSTDSTRAKMTVLTAMAAVYPAYPCSWSDEINWVPTPYTTVPAKYDINMAVLNCPVFIEAYSALKYNDNPRMAEFFKVLNLVSKQIGSNITTMPGIAYIVYDAFVSQTHLGIPLNKKIAAIMPDLKAASDIAVDIIFGNKDILPFQAGTLLNDFFKYTAEQIIGTDTPPVRIYSGHDFNVYSLQAISQVTTRQGVPNYASAFALELRQIVKTGEYVVLPVYQPTPLEDLVYLPVAGCNTLLCPYKTFKKIVSPYLLDEDTWRIRCGFTKDLVVDDSGL